VAGRLLDSRLAFLAGAPFAIGLGIAAGAHPFLALAGAGAVLLLALVVLRADLLLLVLVAALPWEGALAYPTESVTAVKLLGVLLFVAWILRALVRSEPLRVSPVLGWVGLLGLAVGLSLLLAPDPSQSVFDALRYALFIVFFFLILQLTHTSADVRRIVRVMVLSSSLAACWGLYGLIVLGISRAAGPISDPNDFAYLMTCVLPLAGYLLVSERRRRVLWAICCLVLLSGALGTLSRGALVGLSAVVLWGLVTRRIPVSGILLGIAGQLSVAAIAFSVWAPLLHDRLQQKGNIAERNVTTRQALWAAALRMAEDRPVTGVGPGRFGIEAPQYVRNVPLTLERPYVHNSYLSMLAETGLLGLLAFAGFLASTWRLLGRARRDAIDKEDIEARRLGTAMQASLVVAIVAGIFLSGQLTTPFWLLGALAAVVAGTAERVPAVQPARGAQYAAAPA
jgi:putative inorganic carbon (HCO3(-)) transporter